MSSCGIITEFDIKLDRNKVFSLIDLYPDQGMYGELLELFEDLEPLVMKSMKPQAFLKYGQASEELVLNETKEIKSGTPVVYVLMTLNDEVTELASQYFDNGEYLLGLLINAMSDYYLFQMDDAVTERINHDCCNRHLGILQRLEAPATIPMRMQQVILEEIKEEIPLSMDVTSGFMYTSLKTLGYILILSDGQSTPYLGHDCSSCIQVNCKMRK